MTLMRVRRAAQVTLPAEVRKALNLKEGDYLEAQIVEDGVLLKPVAVIERKRARAGVLEAVSQVEDREAEPDEDVRAEEEAIAREVEAMRRKNA